MKSEKFIGLLAILALAALAVALLVISTSKQEQSVRGIESSDLIGPGATSSAITIKASSTRVLASSTFSSYARIENRGTGDFVCLFDNQEAASSTVTSTIGVMVSGIGKTTSTFPSVLEVGKCPNCLPIVRVSANCTQFGGGGSAVIFQY